mgnify:FL=1
MYKYYKWVSIVCDSAWSARHLNLQYGISIMEDISLWDMYAKVYDVMCEQLWHNTSQKPHQHWNFTVYRLPKRVCPMANANSYGDISLWDMYARGLWFNVWTTLIRYVSNLANIEKLRHIWQPKRVVCNGQSNLILRHVKTSLQNMRLISTS